MEPYPKKKDATELYAKSSIRSRSELQYKNSKITDVFNYFGFPLSKLISNCPDILNNDDLNANSLISLGNNVPAKILGFVTAPVEKKIISTVVKKRSILSTLI